MLATPAHFVVERLRGLRAHPNAGPVTDQAVELLRSLFGTRARAGVSMAMRALRGAVPAGRVEGVRDAFVRAVMEGLGGA